MCEMDAMGGKKTKQKNHVIERDPHFVFLGIENAMAHVLIILTAFGLIGQRGNTGCGGGFSKVNVK